jgi:hypothetical protein
MSTAIIKQYDDIAMNFWRPYFESMDTNPSSIPSSDYNTQIVDIKVPQDSEFIAHNRKYFDMDTIRSFYAFIRDLTTQTFLPETILCISFGNQSDELFSIRTFATNPSALYFFEPPTLNSHVYQKSHFKTFNTSIILSNTSDSQFLNFCRDKLRDRLTAIVPKCKSIMIVDMTNNGVNCSLTWLKQEIPSENFIIVYRINKVIGKNNYLILFRNSYNHSMYLQWLKQVLCVQVKTSGQNYTGLDAVKTFLPFYGPEDDIHLYHHAAQNLRYLDTADLFIPIKYNVDEVVHHLKSKIIQYESMVFSESNTNKIKQCFTDHDIRIGKLWDEELLIRAYPSVGPDGLKFFVQFIHSKQSNDPASDIYLSPAYQTNIQRHKVMSDEYKWKKAIQYCQSIWSNKVTSFPKSMSDLDQLLRQSIYNQTRLGLTYNNSLTHCLTLVTPSLTQDQRIYMDLYYYHGCLRFNLMHPETQTILVRQEYDKLQYKTCLIYAQRTVPRIRVDVVYNNTESNIVVVKPNLIAGTHMTHPATINVLSNHGHIVLLAKQQQNQLVPVLPKKYMDFAMYLYIMNEQIMAKLVRS